MSDTATTSAGTPGSTPTENLIDGLRAAADFLESHPELELDRWYASIRRHVPDGDDYLRVVETLGVESVRRGTFIHATRFFGPVVLEAQTDVATENLAAFWRAYRIPYGHNERPGPLATHDMARRFALTDEQVHAVLEGLFGAEMAGELVR